MANMQTTHIQTKCVQNTKTNHQLSFQINFSLRDQLWSSKT